MIRRIPERELTARDRRRIGDLLVDAFELEPPLREHTLEHGYIGAEPSWRLVFADPEIGGHLAVFELSTRPPARAFGLGDVAVDPAWRGRGVARSLADAAMHELVGQRHAQAVLLRTAALRTVFERHGLRRIADAERRRLGLADEHGWMAWTAPELRLESVEPEDF